MIVAPKEMVQVQSGFITVLPHLTPGKPLAPSLLQVVPVTLASVSAFQPGPLQLPSPLAQVYVQPRAALLPSWTSVPVMEQLRQ